MKSLKLIIVFLSLAGVLVVALNWSSLFGFQSGEENEFVSENQDRLQVTKVSEAQTTSEVTQPKDIGNEILDQAALQEEAKEIEKRIAKEVILNLVKKNVPIQTCRDVTDSWKLLSPREQNAVEAILDIKRWGGKPKIKNFLRDLQINSWEDIMNAQQEIIRIESRNK